MVDTMNLRPAKIFFAIDFTRFSHSVLNYAISLTRKFGARLYVFHSICFPKNEIYGTTEYKRADEWEDALKLSLEKIDRLMENQSIPWEPLVTHGDPVDQIVDNVKKINPDLIVAASHGLSGLRRLLAGTVVERMARTVDRPFIVVRPDRAKPLQLDIDNILVGCDFSFNTKALIRFAEKWCVTFKAALTLFHAIESPINEELQDPTEAPYDEVQQKLQDRLFQRLSETGKRNASNTETIKTIISQGLPGEELIHYASRNRVSLIVVGVQSHGAFEKIFIGSTTEFVLRHAPCPVLTLPVNQSGTEV